VINTEGSNFKEEKIYFRSQFLSFQPLVTWLRCSWAEMRWSIMAESMQQDRTALLMVTWKQRELGRDLVKVYLPRARPQ
jgi:hypothetical protein